MGKSRRQDTRAEQTDRFEIRCLKAANKKLQKEVAQLRKELGKRGNVEAQLKELLEENQSREFEAGVVEKPKCPKCDREAVKIEDGQRVILICSDRTGCKWRTRKK